MSVRTVAMTLWDVISAPEPRQSSVANHRPIQSKYDAIVEKMKETYGFRIRKWRSSMSGCAWELRDKQGNITRMVESPFPRGPMSCVIFLHEVGHHAIGFHVYKPRCLEEYYAWEWAMKAMEANDVRITTNVLKRRDNALRYALAKALRRGLKRVPVELEQFLPEHVIVAS